MKGALVLTLETGPIRSPPLVYSIMLHPFVMGQPFRLRAFQPAMEHKLHHREQLWLTAHSEVARYSASLPPGIIP